MECAGYHLGACDGPVDIRCGACGAVRYCSRAHQNQHWTEHRRDCERLAEQMQRGVLFNEFPFSWTEEATWPADAGDISVCSFLEHRGLHGRGIWQAECKCSVNRACDDVAQADQLAEWHLPSSLCPCSGPSTLILRPLTSWSEYYTWRELALDSPVALLLHWPLTLYYALSLVVTEVLWSPSSQKNLRILYLGPEKELEELFVFGELLGLVVGADIHIDLVGPAVPSKRDGELVKVSGYPKCLDVDCRCKGGASQNSGGSLVFKLWNGMYHDRHPELCEGPRPHLIVAPNAGIAAFSSWQQTIELILESGVPAFFTDYCEEAGFLSEQCIRTLHDTTLSFPVQMNPFRQPLATSNKGLEVPTYSNCVIFGIN